MKRLYKSMLASLALISAPCLLFAGKKTIKKTAVVTCGAEALECTAVVNAIGDPVEIDVSKLGVSDLGKIQAEETKSIALPTEVGTQKVYSLTPTTGESANEVIHIVFNNIKHRRGTRLFGKTQIRIYRRFAAEPKGAPWIEVGQIEVDAKKLLSEEASIDISIKPDGTASWKNPLTGETTVFQLGVKELG